MRQLIAFVCLIILGASTTAFGQEGISPRPVQGHNFRGKAAPRPGMVTDTNGAAIPNARVTLRGENTGVTKTVTTDDDGIYSVAGLPPGTYSVEVEAAGFNRVTMHGVVIQPGEVAAPGIELPVGSAAEAVAVTSVAPAINPTASQTSAHFESRKLRDLPGLTSVDAFAQLSPGASLDAPDSATRPMSGWDQANELRFLLNGNRPHSNSFTVNEHDNTGIDGLPAVSIHNFDAADVLHVLRTRGAGDVSLTGASSLNLIVRSGTNDFHGTVFDYYLNRRLGALSPLERRSGLLEPPKFKNNTYGGTFGGPIRRDRVFFFGAFQGEEEVARHFVDSTSSFLTPTESGLAALAEAFPDSATINDLIARGPLAREVGSSQIQRAFLIPVLGVPVEFGQVTRIVPSRTRGYEAGTRFDFILTNRDRLQANYWYDSHRVSNVAGRLVAGYAGNAEAHAQLGGVRWERSISPRTTNEIAFGFNRARLSLRSGFDVLNADDAPGGLTPSVNIGFRGLAYGSDPFIPASQVSTLFEASDALSYIVRRHNVKLGGQARWRITSFDYLPGAGGHYTYASFEDFAQNRPFALTVAAGDPRSRFTGGHFHVYADDAWRVRSNLTLSVGLSYENASQPFNGLAERLRERQITPATITNVKGDNNNFAPRFGFAYTPDFRVLGRNLFGFDRTVIRGGVSVSYDQTAYRPLADVAASAPNVLFGVLTLASGIELPRFPNVPNESQLRAIFTQNPGLLARAVLASDFRNPYSLQWNLSATRDFNDRVITEFGYVGTRGVGLIRALDASSEPMGLVRMYASTGRSIYHALQARTEVRLRDSLTGEVAYTFSKLIDDVPDSAARLVGGVGSLASLAAPSLQGFAQDPGNVSDGERAVSSLDRRHATTANFVWSLPTRRWQSGFLNRLFDGWKASAVVGVASGAPYTALQHFGYAGPAAIFAAAFADRLSSARPFAANPFAAPEIVAFSNAANAYYKFFLNPDGTPVQSDTGFIIADRNGVRAGSVSEARFVYNDYGVEQAARALGLAPDAFGQTYAAGRPFGDVGRNTLRGPRLANVDFALLKTTKLTEKVSLQFRAEFFNFFNHPNRGVPNYILENAGGFGFADRGETDAAPRRVRLALKLLF